MIGSVGLVRALLHSGVEAGLAIKGPYLIEVVP